MDELSGVTAHEESDPYGNGTLVPDDFWGAKPRAEDVRELVDAQAEDEGLWFMAETAAEAYLQQELRRLHALIEEVL